MVLSLCMMTKISETTGKKIDPNPQIGDSLKAKMSIWIPKNNPMITPITINIIPRIAMVLLRVNVVDKSIFASRIIVSVRQVCVKLRQA